MSEKETPWVPKQMIWCSILAIILWSAAGFNWFGPGFGWVTSGSVKSMTEETVNGKFADICVAQAKADPQSEKRLAEIKSESSWQRSEGVGRFGWNKMPGQRTATYGVSALCAEKLFLE